MTREIFFNRIFKKDDSTNQGDQGENKNLQWEKTNNIQGKYETLIKESNDVFEIIDQYGIVKYISEASERITGVKPKDRIGQSLFKFYESEEANKLSRMIDSVIEGPNKKVRGNVIIRNNENKEFYLEVNMQNLLDNPDVDGIALNFRDITKRVEMEKRITYISTHDELTGLPNRNYFLKKLSRQCENAEAAERNFALMMLDLDGLKYVKYMLGYKIGDKLILEVVKRLRAYLGTDIFISRFSDDHFSIIIPGFEKAEDYERIGQGIINLFSRPYRIKAYELDLMANIGICIFPNGADDADSIRKNSEKALFRAKKEGKNTYKFYSSDLDIQSYKEFTLRSDLHNAIERNQLKVYYQPIVNLKNNQILAAEALLRWEHPEWGMVPPDEFIPLIEESSLIIRIGKWVMEEVCESYKKWKKEGMPEIKISVNISAVQTMEKDFVKNIKDIIDKYRLDPRFLILELTENILLNNGDKVNSDIKDLQSYGIQVAIDGFGTGFSSLPYLETFNIDILKIDRFFIKNIPRDNSRAIITETIINLSRELNIKLVVEGIENEEQLTYLKGLNSYAGQGYLYSRPLPIDDFEKILRGGVCKPILRKGISRIPQTERRRFFRINFLQLLESDLTIQSFKRRKINVGNTKILIKNIGPGGLCFISNIRFPVDKEIILQFTTILLNKELKIYGHPVWTKELEKGLYEYGVEFTIDENERMDLIKELNQVQIKMRKNTLFAEGSFISGTYPQYFLS